MTLGIYSLQKVLYQGEARSINCKTASGEVTILDHHRPLISTLREGTIKIIDSDGKERYIAVSSGFIEFDAKNQAKVLVQEK